LQFRNIDSDKDNIILFRLLLFELLAIAITTKEFIFKSGVMGCFTTYISDYSNNKKNNKFCIRPQSPLNFQHTLRYYTPANHTI